MAEIDKGLPNVRREINIPSVEEQTEVIADLQETAPSHEKTEVVENDDGSVDINFEPGAVASEAAGGPRTAAAAVAAASR